MWGTHRFVKVLFAPEWNESQKESVAEKTWSSGSAGSKQGLHRQMCMFTHTAHTLRNICTRNKTTVVRQLSSRRAQICERASRKMTFYHTESCTFWHGHAYTGVNGLIKVNERTGLYCKCEGKVTMRGARMLKLKSCSGELLMLGIVPTDTASYRLSFSPTHTHKHSCNPQLLVQTGNSVLVTLSGFGVCVSALLSPAAMRGMFVVVSWMVNVQSVFWCAWI